MEAGAGRSAVVEQQWADAVGGVGGLQAGQGDGDGATAGVGVVERHGDAGAGGAGGVQRLAQVVAGAEGAGVPVDVLVEEAGERVRFGSGGGGRRGGGEQHRHTRRECLGASGS